MKIYRYPLFFSSKNQLGGSVDRGEGSTDARCAGLAGREREGGERESRSRGGPAAEQIPGLIDGTTGALDFPRVARAFPSFPLTPRYIHIHLCVSPQLLTILARWCIHPALARRRRATREQLCHWAVCA